MKKLSTSNSRLRVTGAYKKKRVSCILSPPDQCVFVKTNINSESSVGRQVEKSSWKECRDHCNAESQCHAWSFATQGHTNEGRCVLKDANFRRSLIPDKEHMLSGEKKCGISMVLLNQLATII